MLSTTYLCLPHEGHLEAVFHVFAYLALHHNARVMFDPTYPSVDIGTLPSSRLIGSLCMVM
jgi:hypothetical protein